jgi:hypothetical protein
MTYTTELKIDPETIRAFVREHFARNKDTNLGYVTSGFRVKFGRPMMSNESAIVNELYAELDRERTARRLAEEAEREARKPKGFQRVLASGWRSQALVGTVTWVAALYYFAGLDLAMQIMFYLVGFTQGMGFFVVVAFGWLLAAGVVWGLRKIFHYTVPVAILAGISQLVDNPLPTIATVLA